MIVDTVVIQRAEPMPSYQYDAMLALTQARHAAYCMLHRCEYDGQIIKSERYNIIQGGWEKIALIHEAMQKGYKNIIWLDADTLIVDTNTPLTDAIRPGKIGACWHRIPQLNHWNVGALYISNTPETQAFIAEWLAQPNPNNGWNEQGVFNRLAMKSKAVETISDRWNATLNYSMVPDAVVLGYHGYADSQGRLQAMKDTLNSLEAREGTR